MEIQHRAGRSRMPTAMAFPKRGSPLKHVGGPGARQGQVLFDARPGRSRRRLLSAQERNARPRQRCCRRPGAPSDETNTSGQLSFSAAFFSYNTIVSFTAGVAGVFSTLHHMRKAWCKQKKVWVHGFFLCRERPAWWGALAENIPRIVHVSKCARVKHVVYDAASLKTLPTTVNSPRSG